MTNSATSAAGPTTPRDEPLDDSIDLRAYALAFWAYRVWIVGSGTVLALVALLVGVLTPRSFEAQVVLAIVRSKLSTFGNEPPLLPTASFRPFLQNQSLAARVVAELKLDKPPYSISPSEFLREVVSIEEIRSSPVMVLKTTLEDPTLAARAANLLAELAVESTRRVNNEEAGSSRDGIRLQRDEAQQRLRDAESALRTYREESQVEALRRDVSAALDMRQSLLPLTVNIEAKRAGLARAQTELGQRPRVEVTQRTIDSDPALLEGARALAGTPNAANLLGLQTRNEYANPVYETMDGLVATTQTDLAAMERQKHEIVDVRKLDAPRLTELTRLYEVEARLSQLETERNLAKDVYVEVATTYETAGLQVAGRSAQLQVIGAAVPTDLPISRHLARNTLAAFLIGVSLAAAAALVARALAAG
jgi:uncharacterized protein involved in exopolysaccharide biosynthesis